MLQQVKIWCSMRNSAVHSRVPHFHSLESNLRVFTKDLSIRRCTVAFGIQGLNIPVLSCVTEFMSSLA